MNWWNPIHLTRGAIRCLKAQLKYLRTKKLAPFEEQNRRRKICETCPIREGFRCGECECPLTEKAELKDEVCPADNW